MKIQYVGTGSYSGQIYDVLEESPSWWIGVVRKDGCPHLCLKSEFKPVSEERWVDISHECGIVKACFDEPSLSMQHHPGTNHSNTLFDIPKLMELEGYKIRKVENFARDHTIGFIIQRKVPHDNGQPLQEP